MKILLDDYKRKLEHVQQMLNQKGLSIETNKRLTTKLHEYKSFILDIEKAIIRDKYKSNREEIEEELFNQYQEAYVKTKEGETYPIYLNGQQIDWVINVIKKIFVNK